MSGRAGELGGECLKLTAYFGERDRCHGRFLADALIDLYAQRRLRTSVLLRGAEGFGIKHRLHTQRLLSLSEDLPIVSVAVDERERVEAVTADVVDLFADGLVTLERARMAAAPGDVRGLDGDAKLTVYVGRQERCGGRPAYVRVVELLRRAGVEGATALLGVDGTADGERRRARFFSANAEVPVMVISVGRGESIAAAVPELMSVLARPLMTLERVRVLRRDGRRLAEPDVVPAFDAQGRMQWRKLMVYSREHARDRGAPLHLSLIRTLRREGAAGATLLRGIWGYHGDHAPHGDTLWSLRRDAPLVTVIVDAPAPMERWLEVVAAYTAQAGLVTSEIVPAFRATGPGIEHGGLALADHWRG